MHNKGLERSLKDFEVHCTYATSGCEWIGKLWYLDDHLNLNSDFEKQLEGCDFVEIGCNHQCGGVFSRRMLASVFACKGSSNVKGRFLVVTLRYISLFQPATVASKNFIKLPVYI